MPPQLFCPLFRPARLGEQISWMVSVLGGAEDVTEDIATAHFADALLLSKPAADLALGLQEMAAAMRPARQVPGTLVSRSHDDSAVAGFEVAGANDQLLLVSIEGASHPVSLRC